MRRDIRKEQILKRKNFLPTLILTILAWSGLGGIFLFVDPATFGAVPVFFLLIFFTFLFTISLVLRSARRGLIGALAVVLFLFLGYLGIGNYLNLILISAIAICIELYLSYK